VTDLRDSVRQIAQTYQHGADRPLPEYALTMGVYSGLVSALSAIARMRGRRLPDRPSLADTVLLAIATHKASRLLAKDPVTSPLRAPFTVFRGQSGESELAEKPRPGRREAFGELISCPFCVDQWLATVGAFGLVLAPRATRFAANVFAIRAGADVLQFGYDWLQRAATE
jgi:hypothetical protein